MEDSGEVRWRNNNLLTNCKENKVLTISKIVNKTLDSSIHSGVIEISQLVEQLENVTQLNAMQLLQNKSY